MLHVHVSSLQFILYPTHKTQSYQYQCVCAVVQLPGQQLSQVRVFFLMEGNIGGSLLS